MKNLTIIIISLCFSFCVNANAISAQDFRYNIQLIPTSESSLYNLNLPEDVYLKSTERNFGDLFIFNSRGKVVPIDIEKIAPKESTTIKIFEIPFFKTYKEIKSADDLQLSIAAKNKNGETVDIKISGEKSDNSEVIYIDTKQIKDDINIISTIILNWDSTDNINNLIFPVIIEDSKDLTTWRHICTSNLIDFNNSSSKVIENNIPLNSKQNRFIRIRFSDKNRTPAIKSIQGKSSVSTLIKYEKWHKTTLKKNTERKNSFQVQISNNKQSNRIINGIKIRPKDKNSLYSIKLYYKHSEKDNWHYHSRENIFYMKNYEEKLVKEIISLPENSAKFWLLEFENSINDISIDDFESIEYRWRPHKITFLAQGEPPYTMAFGENYRTIKNRPGNLQQRISNYTTKMDISNAIKIGKITENRITPPPKPQKTVLEKYKSLILWIIISIFILGLLYIAVKLAKEIHKEEN